jgi:uncharacterized membrane protein YcaP (DUF421 family)
MTFNDLMEGIRTAGYFNLEELLYVILQTNGSMTVVNRAEYTPVTAEDMKIEKQQASLPVIIVNKGKINKENLALTQINENFLLENIKQVGIKSIKDILILTIDNYGKIYVQPTSGKFQTIETKYSKGDKW